jgi:hypothetical protein
MAWCSMAEQTATPAATRTAPKIAMLSASVPPLVKTRSAGARRGLGDDVARVVDRRGERCAPSGARLTDCRSRR